jgi:uncharacterized protein YraI
MEEGMRRRRRIESNGFVEPVYKRAYIAGGADAPMYTGSPPSPGESSVIVKGGAAEIQRVRENYPWVTRFILVP